MESIFLEALLSGVLTKQNNIDLVSKENNLVYHIDKPIVLADKYSYLTDKNSAKRYPLKIKRSLKLKEISKINTQK